ncbi:MAG: rhodanese-like domain-containing protein [Bacteroidetes bacterium]|nr:rhodanese-like domain-containing protein [Bacteroidota bacterium]
MGNFIRAIGIILLISFWTPTFAQQAKSLSVEQFDKEVRKKGVVVIDVRTAQEFQSGHIKNAINLDFYAPDFTNKLKKLDKKAQVLIYCRSGNRSGQALQLMQSIGFSNFADLAGGTASWLASGKTLVQ